MSKESKESQVSKYISKLDAAMVQAVRSGVDDDAAAEAMNLFAKAQLATLPAAAAFLRRERGDGCPTRSRLLELGELFERRPTPLQTLSMFKVAALARPHLATISSLGLNLKVWGRPPRGPREAQQL